FLVLVNILTITSTVSPVWQLQARTKVKHSVKVHLLMYGVYYHDVAILFNGPCGHCLYGSRGDERESGTCSIKPACILACCCRHVHARWCAVRGCPRNHSLCWRDHGVVRVRGDDAESG